MDTKPRKCSWCQSILNVSLSKLCLWLDELLIAELSELYRADDGFQLYKDHHMLPRSNMPYATSHTKNGFYILQYKFGLFLS